MLTSQSESGSLFLSLNPLQNPAANPMFRTPAGHLESEGAGLTSSNTWECLVYILRQGGGGGRRWGREVQEWGGGRDCFKLQCYESELGDKNTIFCNAEPSVNHIKLIMYLIGT